jgi:hypothetical protein
LSFAGVDQPGAAEKQVGAVLENLEEEDVDGDVAVVEVFDDVDYTLALGRADNSCRPVRASPSETLGAD